MQSSRGIIDGLIRNRGPLIRMGFFDHIWPEVLPEWQKEGYPARADGTPCDPGEVLGFDLFHARGWVNMMPLMTPDTVLGETEEWKVVQNGAGAVMKYWKKKSGTPEHIDFAMRSAEIWQKTYKPHLAGLQTERIVTDGTKDAMRRLGDLGIWRYFGVHFIWEQMRASMGDVGMLEALLLDKAWVHDFNRTYTDFFKRYYTWVFENLGKPEGMWVHEDLGYKNGLFCSPDLLAELVFPYYRELVEFFHGHGLPVLFHSCGRVHEALDLIADAGFDALNPMEFKAGMDVVDVAARYKARFTFIGGMDVRIFEGGDHAKIRAEIIRITSAMRDLKARYIFGSDHSIPPTVSYRTFLYIRDVFRDHMYY